jgi:hypothetical protein
MSDLWEDYKDGLRDQLLQFMHVLTAMVLLVVAGSIITLTVCTVLWLLGVRV